MSEECDPVDSVAVVSKLCRDLTSDSTFKSMKRAMDNSLELRKENDALRTTNSQNLKSIAQVEAEMVVLKENLKEKETDLEKTKAKKTELERELEGAKQEIQSTSEKFTEEMKAKNGKEARIHELEKQLKEEKSRVSAAEQAQRKAQSGLEKVQEDLRQAEEERNTKDSELQTLRKLAISMEPLTNEKMKENVEAIFTSAYKLAETYFTKDLGVSVLKDPAIWGDIQSQEPIQRWPLPYSNSLAAKQMRLAAFLAALGHTLQKHIFQVTYLLEEPEELSCVLSNLARNDPERETYLRSVLLAAYADPKEREKVATERIGDVLEDMKCFQNIVPEDSRDAFENALRNTCRLACRNWNILLRQPVAVERCLEPGRHVTATYWRLLPGLGQAPGTATSAPNSNQKLANGEAAPSSAKGAADRTRPETPMKRNDVETIWPVFLSVVGNQPEVIMMGVVINNAMMAPAHDELDSTNATSDELSAPHRSRRQSLRAEKGKASSVNSSRGSKKAFLPSGGGNGAKSG